MSLPTHTQILIVGAGPTGMTCAFTLHRLGLHVTLVDGFPDNRNGSRSAVVHAHTLEALDTIGLAKPLLEAGIQTSKLTMRGSTHTLFEINLEQLRDETEFPMALLISQHDVEVILRRRLVEAGVKILRPHTVVGMKEAPSKGGLDVTFDDGSVVRSQYVVGADGSRSSIRRLANIDFKDPATGVDYDDKTPQSSSFQLALADVYIEEPRPTELPRDTLSLFLDKFILMCPLRTNEGSERKDVSRYRIGLGRFPGDPPIPRNPDIAFLQEAVNKRCPWPTKPRIVSVEMSSRYRVRSAVASTLFKKIGAGNVLLVGDAAHVHSPAGGQGLNLGICDAVALGRTIHAHVNVNPKADTEKRSDALLENYTISRRKIALRVIATAGGMTLLIRSGSGWRRLLRNMVFWIVNKSPFLRRAAAWRLSGLGNREGDF